MTQNDRLTVTVVLLRISGCFALVNGVSILGEGVTDALEYDYFDFYDLARVSAKGGLFAILGIFFVFLARPVARIMMPRLEWTEETSEQRPPRRFNYTLFRASTYEIGGTLLILFGFISLAVMFEYNLRNWIVDEWSVQDTQGVPVAIFAVVGGIFVQSIARRVAHRQALDD